MDLLNHYTHIIERTDDSCIFQLSQVIRHRYQKFAVMNLLQAFSCFEEEKYNCTITGCTQLGLGEKGTVVKVASNFHKPPYSLLSNNWQQLYIKQTQLTTLMCRNDCQNSSVIIILQSWEANTYNHNVQLSHIHQHIIRKSWWMWYGQAHAFPLSFPRYNWLLHDLTPQTPPTGNAQSHDFGSSFL